MDRYRKIKALTELLMHNQAELKKKDQVIAALQKNISQLDRSKRGGGAE